MSRFAIPFGLATTLGLAAVALTGDPSMRTLSPSDVSAGLPAAAALEKQGLPCYSSSSSWLSPVHHLQS